ncbi:hypothetical protein [Kitasatospora sp. NBC_01302]|uniref:hypothetical protein n=1 Tax=Kitasatospora sp. NBC_01302 TaxID=2903575 RepID=UPI002E14E0E9|nr:hypothetical protein OG294_14375 [Kitasatospora sp. NBC_01302]
MAPYNPVPRTLWDLASSGLGTTLTASGNSGTTLIDLLDVTDVWLSLYVAGTSTGTSPTLLAQLDVQDPDGNWFPQVAKTAQLTSAPNYSSVSAGLHIASTGSMVLPRWCRVAWTVGGTSPVFPQASICLTGR